MFRVQANAFQNYIDAWNEVFKKPVDASKFANFLDETDIQSMIGLTDESSKNSVASTVCQIVGNDTGRLYTLKTSEDKYYRIYHNGKEIFNDEKFVKTLIHGNIIYVQRESDEKWNGINKNGNLVWDEWMTSVKKVLSGDILVKKEGGSFFLADENGVPIDIDIEKEKGESEVKEDNKDTPCLDDAEYYSVEEYDDEDDIEDDTEVEIEDDEEDECYPYYMDEESLIKECGSDTVEAKLRHFYAEKLPEIKREVVDTATELAEMFCEDIFQGICNELTGSPDLYWDIESDNFPPVISDEDDNFPIIPDEDDDKSGGTPARDVVSAEEPTKPQEVSDENIKNVSKIILKDTEAKMDEMARAFIRKEIEELLNKKQNKTANLVSSDENWKPTPNWRDWFRSDTRQFS